MAIAPADMLVVIDAEISDRVQNGQSSGANGASWTGYSLSDLWKMRANYAQLAQAQAGANGSLQICKVTNLATSA